jgi:heterotetrameric sarcosine oxidase delta subunit
MILLTCPNCGPRNASEFRYGGEAHARPNPNATTPGDWMAYVYMRDNPRGPLREWWYHRAGCGQWFIAERDTKTQQIERTYPWTAEGGGA